MQVEQLVRPLLNEQDYELVAADFAKEPQGLTLRIFIDSENGVTIGDCASVSELISAALDRKDLIKGRYVLEVSSPGIERPLVERKDFAKHKGLKVYVKTFAPINGRKRFTGILESVAGDSFMINCEGKLFSVPYDSVAKAHLVVDDIFS